MGGQGFDLETILQDRSGTRRLFAGVVETIQDIIFIADCEDKIVYANPPALKKFGYTLKEMLGQKSHFIVSPPPANPVGMAENIYNGTLKKGVWTGECFNRTKSGEDFPVFLTTGIVYNEKGERIALTGVAKDITELKKTQSNLKETAEKLMATQKQLVNSEKLAALGGLAHGLAHEIGNPISSISSLVQVLSRKLEQQEGPTDDFQSRLASNLETIQGQVERVSQILQHMRELSQTRMFVRERVELFPIIKEAVERAHFQIEKTEIEVQLVECLYKNSQVFVLRNQLRQVFLNIILSIIESMDKNGLLSIRVSQDEKNIKVLFWDTKNLDKNQSVGLGLSVSQSIVQSFGGDILIEFKENEGTKISVILPAVKGGREL